MSKQNMVNKSNYDQAGRLTPDDLARERIKQAAVSGQGKDKTQVIGKTPSQPGAPGSTPPRSAPEE